MERGDIDFFYQATLRICSSLDIETMLADSFEYIRRYIPANGITLSLFDNENGVLNIISGILDPYFIQLPKLIRLTPDAVAYIRQHESSDDPNDPVNQPEDHPVIKLAWQAIGKPDSSYIVSRLKVQNEVIGLVTLIARGRNIYSQRHMEMLNLLQGPFAIAMSNGLKHMELLKLKEILADENMFLKNQLHRKAGDEIIGGNSGLKDVMMMVQQVAPLASQVLLLGETGVGKEIIANAIHYSSDRADGPFIKVNCGAIPESLIDSELFGHEKGAYTGAVETKRGRFERADKGTIFLDEIAELPLQAQVRLLRVIQSREFERVGGTRPIPLNIRIIAATNRDLEEMVRSRSFRKDLWFRLNVFPITIPPLRHRKEDIPALVNYFIEKKSKEMNLRFTRRADLESISILRSYPWPGNVRELENVVERALIRNINSPPERLLYFDRRVFEINQQELPSAPISTPDSMRSDDVIRLHIESVLKMVKGRIQGANGAAEILGVNPSTLRKRMRKLGIPYGRKGGAILSRGYS